MTIKKKSMLLPPEHIIEGNKLICKFMGIDYAIWSSSHKRLDYDNHWSHLMLVVEKINTFSVGEKWFRTIISPTQCDISVYESGYMSVPTKNQSFHVGGKDSMIEATWECVVLFIKWYNQTKTNEQSI